jgi:hypothetical protein
MNIQFIAVLPFFLLLGNLQACSHPEYMPADTAPVSHGIWDSLLHRHVKENGLVDYKGFIRDSVELNRYLGILSAAQPKSKSWSRAEKMAFWINAYNAFTIKLIVDHYPVKSIKDIKRGIPFVNTVWDIKFIKIGGETYDLNQIEHGILRPDFKDARVHAAINCASYSCPPLRNEAFVPERLEAQLDDAMRTFVNDPLRNRIKAKRAEISEIFKWFRADFVRDAGSVRKYVNQYAKEKLDANGRIVYPDYQWHLNDIE